MLLFPTKRYQRLSLFFFLFSFSFSFFCFLQVMNPNSIVCFRDYGIYDAAQLKFSSAKNHKLEENLYIRQDGTMSYFFSIEYLKTLFESEGFKTISTEFIQRETTNQAKHLSVDRLFLQAKFRKVQTGSNEDNDDAKTDGKESSDGFG